jgi:hypothetical protein
MCWNYTEDTLQLQLLQQIVLVSQISNYKHCNNIVTVSQIWNYKQSVTTPDSRSYNQTLAPQQHSKQSVTTLEIGGGGVVMPWALDLRWPPRSSPGVGAGVDRHHRQWSPPVKGIHRSRECCTSCSGGPPSSGSDVHLIGGEHGADPALEAARPVASALPWTTSASQAEIGRPVDLGSHGGVCGLVRERRCWVDLGKVADRPAP